MYCNYDECKAKNKFPPYLSRIPGLSNNPNPGNISSLHKKTKDIMPIWLEGVEFGYKKNLTSNKILQCNWMMSHTNPSGFRIGGIYNWKINDHILATPVIEADINPSTLSTNCTLLYHPIKPIRVECNLQTSNEKYTNKRISIEYIGKSSTISCNIDNIQKNISNITLGYMNSLTTNLSIGSELSLAYNGSLYNSQTALVGRYKNELYVLAGSCCLNAFDISYWRQVHQFLQMGTSLAYNKTTSNAIGSIFYQYELKDAYIRGMIDSDWSVGFTYNRRIPEMCCNLGFSLLLSITNNKFISGFKFDLNPNTK